MSASGWFRTMGGLGVLWLASVGPTEAFQAELKRYYESTKDICRTGVTPEIVSAYEQARQAMDRAGGLGSSNFAGIKRPTEVLLDCYQSPGDGKT